MLKNIWIIFAVFMGLIFQASADIAVIVNLKNTAAWDNDRVQTYVKEIFLNTKEKFPDGTSARAVDQSEGQPIRQDFYLKVAGKDETAMNVYWSNLIFTGNGRPPKTIGDDAAVKRYVNENIGGIGYIKTESVDNTVKTIYTIQ